MGQQDALELIGELLGVDVGPEVAFADSRADDEGQRLELVALGAHELVAHRPLLVVELAGGIDEEAASVERLGLPAQPALEELAQAGLPARHRESRPQDDVGEPATRVLEHLHLEGLLGGEVGVEPALASFVAAARVPMVRPPNPTREASSAASSRIAVLVSSPLLMHP